MAVIIREQMTRDAIICDEKGTVIFNCFQQDRAVIRRVYSDGECDIITADTKEVLIPKRDVMKGLPPCRHCGKPPYHDEPS